MRKGSHFWGAGYLAPSLLPMSGAGRHISVYYRITESNQNQLGWKRQTARYSHIFPSNIYSRNIHFLFECGRRFWPCLLLWCSTGDLYLKTAFGAPVSHQSPLTLCSWHLGAAQRSKTKVFLKVFESHVLQQQLVLQGLSRRAVLGAALPCTDQLTLCNPNSKSNNLNLRLWICRLFLIHLEFSSKSLVSNFSRTATYWNMFTGNKTYICSSRTSLTVHNVNNPFSVSGFGDQNWWRFKKMYNSAIISGYTLELTSLLIKYIEQHILLSHIQNDCT